MSEDGQPADEPGQDELIAAFAALGGKLTKGELEQLLGSEEYYSPLVRLATLLLDGNAAVAEDVARDSLAALQQAWSRLADPGQARVYLYQAVVNRSRSVLRHRVIDGRVRPKAAPDEPGAAQAAAGSRDREPWVLAVRVLPVRQREAVVLQSYLGLSGMQAAEVMGISIGAARSHLARGLSSLRHEPGPE